MIDEDAIGKRYELLSQSGVFDERRRRFWAAAEAASHGRGGVAAVARATGLNEETVRRGVRELESGEVLAQGRVRRVGAGKRPVSETHPGIETALEALGLDRK